MAKYTGWKKRYSYLDDYKKGMDGTYVYYGRHYLFQGTDRGLKRYKWILGLADLLLAGLYIVSGCMDGKAIWSMWYVILPFAAEAVAIFLLIWKSLTLIMEKQPVKAYLYKKSVPWFQPVSVILMIACLLSICATILCMLLHPEDVRISACILYLVLKLLMAGISFALIKVVKQNSWELDPSEEME